MIEFPGVRRLTPGDEIAGKFVLRECLGRGGSGVVYAAWESNLGRTVALKFPLSTMHLDSVVTEGQALAAFRHEGLPTVYAIDSFGHIPFLVMEYLSGHTMSDIIERHRDGPSLPWREAVHYVRSLVSVVQVLHQANLAHCDIKPSNIIICPNGRMVLIDLGIVHQEWQRRDNSEVAGTPYYIAPEAVSASVDTGCAHLLDIYALGTVAFELITGAKPYTAETLDHLYWKIQHGPVPRARAVCAQVPEALDELVALMMAKSPDERPVSVDKILYMLGAIAEGRSLLTEDQPRSVLMVDDDVDYHALMAACVELLPRRVDLRLVSDGAQALEMLRRRPCDLAIVDLEMPNMSGMELCMYLRGIPESRDTLVAVLSGKAKPPDKVLLNQLGVIDFIEKANLTIEQFIARLNSLINRAASMRLRDG